MKHRSNKKILFAVAAILAVSAISIPGTLAYFSDYDQAAGEASVSLAWQTELKEQMTDNNKHITVANVGETDVIVRVQVFDEDFVTVKDTENGWIKAGDWYYYNRILKKGETTTELFAQVDATRAPEADFSVVCVQESQRVVYKTNTELKVPDGWSASAVAGIALNGREAD